MKPYDTYGIRKWEFLDIVWEVEVKVKLPSSVSGYSYSDRIGEKLLRSKQGQYLIFDEHQSHTKT